MVKSFLYDEKLTTEIQKLEIQGNSETLMHERLKCNVQVKKVMEQWPLYWMHFMLQSKDLVQPHVDKWEIQVIIF